jgi:hypothetical protein
MSADLLDFGGHPRPYRYAKRCGQETAATGKVQRPTPINRGQAPNSQFSRYRAEQNERSCASSFFRKMFETFLVGSGENK